MSETDAPASLFRREALDNHARADRDDHRSSFDPASMLPRWWPLLAGVLCLALLVLSGLWYQVQQGPRGLLADVQDDSVIVGLTEAPPGLEGDAVVLVLPDGDRIAGTAVESQQVSGNGITGTMLLVELDVLGAAGGREGEQVTIDSGRTGLLFDIFTDRGGNRG